MDLRRRADAHELAAEAEADRAAILARRQRFIALSLSGLSGLGCQPSGGSTAPTSRDAHAVVADASPPATIVEAEPPLRGASETCPLPGDELPPLPAVEPSPAGTPDERRDRAKQLFEAARIAFEQGRYDDATLGFEAAYRLSPELPELAYDTAKAAYRGGRMRRAQQYLRECLEGASSDPSPLREHAQQLLADIEAQACRPDTPPEPCLKIAVDPDRRRRR